MGHKRKQNRKQNILAAVLLLGCLLLMSLNMVHTFAEQTPMVTDNPIQGISEESSRVLYTGEGYVASELERMEETPQTPIQAEVLEDAMEETDSDNRDTADTESSDEAQAADTDENQIIPGEADNGGGQGTENPSSGDENRPVTNRYEEEDDPQTEHPQEDDEENQPGAETPTPTPEGDPNEGRYPTIYTNLVDLDGTTVDAAYITVQVEAYDWKNRGITAENVQVYANGSQLYPTSASGATSLTYRLDLQDTNEITITATDQNGLSQSTPTYTIYKGDESNQTPEGSVSVAVRATTIGMGYLVPATEVEFYQGEQFPSILLRLLDASGYGYYYDGDLTSGFYLRSITRAGLLEGWQVTDIEEDLRQHLADVNVEPQLPGSVNELGEYSITGESGWMFYVNGEGFGAGMSNYYPADGDRVELKFTLYKGSDTGGSMSGETWEREW